MSGILIIAEHLRGSFTDISAEMIGAALDLKEQLGGPLRVLVVGGDAEQIAPALNLPGVDEVLTVASANPYFDAGVTEEATVQLAQKFQPTLILAGHTAAGMTVAPGVAVRLGSGFAADVFAIEVDNGQLKATRSGYGAKINISVGFPGKPVVVLTLRGATFKPPAGNGSAALTAVPVAEFGEMSPSFEHLEFIEPSSSGIDIAKAEFIMSVGRGIQDEKNVPRFVELADKLGATLGCSRPIADSGWLHKSHQVGLTGKVAANCKLYIALGISGAVQHLHGMKHVETVIAVNSDANAPIFNFATYGATLDLFEFAEALEAML